MSIYKVVDRSGVLVCIALFATLLVAPVAYGQEADASDTANLTPRQQLDYAEGAVSEVKGGVRHVLKMVEQAQKNKDVLLLNCLNEKLAGLKALLKVVEDADMAMQEAMARENNDLANHEFQKVGMARQQASQLVVEAEACVPEVGVSYAGHGRWSVDKPEEQDDADDYLSDPSGFERAPEKSPFT